MMKRTDVVKFKVGDEEFVSKINDLRANSVIHLISRAREPFFVIDGMTNPYIEVNGVDTKFNDLAKFIEKMREETTKKRSESARKAVTDRKWRRNNSVFHGLQDSDRLN